MTEVPRAPSVRRASASDVGAITECVRAAYACYLERLGKPPGPMLDDYEAVVVEDECWVLEDCGRLCGVLVLIEHDGELLLDNVAVHPDAQRRGYGARLIALAEQRARERGFAALDLYTHVLMHENIARYRALGYEETARRRVRGYDRVYMRKTFGDEPVSGPGERSD